MAGESMRSAVLMGGVLVFSFVVAGVRSNPALLWFQMRAAALGPLLAAAAFYAGLYRVMGAGGMTLGSFNENAFAVYLGAGLIIALALVRRRERHAVLLSVAVAMAFLPPILVTGSRNGLVKAMICVGGAFVVQTRKRLALVALAGVLLLAGTLVTVSVAATAAGIEDGWTARYDVARLASGTEYAISADLVRFPSGHAPALDRTRNRRSVVLRLAVAKHGLSIPARGGYRYDQWVHLSVMVWNRWRRTDLL